MLIQMSGYKAERLERLSLQAKASRNGDRRRLSLATLGQGQGDEMEQGRPFMSINYTL
jgi:hypothetical protein